MRLLLLRFLVFATNCVGALGYLITRSWKKLLIAGVLLCASSAHAQYFGGSAFGDGVASTTGYGYLQPRPMPWSYYGGTNINLGYQSFNSYPSYQRPYYAAPTYYVPRVAYPTYNTPLYLRRGR